MTFSGSYPTSDVELLIQTADVELTDIAQKEALIQSGQSHYSDMLSLENAPSDEHTAMFDKALLKGGQRMARETLQLAKAIVDASGEHDIVLVSLIRAGLPLGVLLKRTLAMLTDKPVYNYGVSIIRDRGLDIEAMNHIESQHSKESILFVDGWTGKGAITGELKRSLDKRGGYPETPRLAVLADPGGCAWLAASGDDWLIPSGILGATVSGLVSRTLWSDQGFHRAKLWRHLDDYDISAGFIDQMMALIRELPVADTEASQWTPEERQILRQASLTTVSGIQEALNIDSLNRIKPGIAEATRAVMRRVPDHVFVRSKSDPDVELLCHLAQTKGVTIDEKGNTIGGYRAITVIKKVV